MIRRFCLVLAFTAFLPLVFVAMILWFYVYVPICYVVTGTPVDDLLMGAGPVGWLLDWAFRR